MDEQLTLPEGRYLTCPIDVAVDAGGQTRALLMRNRIFAAAAGVRPSVLTFSSMRDLDRRREILLERGLLRPDVDLLNIYEHFRDTDWKDNPEVEEPRPLTDLSRYKTREETLRDGSPWRRSYRLPGADLPLHDYLRADGTTWLRIPQFVFKRADTWPRKVERVSRAGLVLGQFKSASSFFRQYVRELSEGHTRSFVFIDSRFIAPFLAPMKAPNIHLLYLLHNVHVGGTHRWDSPFSDVYERLMSLVGDFDAFVTLTDRQRQDIAQRRGRTSNLFVVPNPVDMPPEPRDKIDRDPRLVSVVARLEGQKRLSHVIEAFRHVVAEIPDARLEIWGSGSRAGGLQEAILRRGLQDSVTLMGHHPQARDNLWRSSAMLMTSLFEGYPLSTLESLSHGCPVVSYDIAYGPREQITDGVDGFLVEPGDTRTLAKRIVTLLRDPELVARMSEAARETARRHGNARFVSDWAEVIDAAIAQKPFRTDLKDAELTVHDLTVRDRRRPVLRSAQRRSRSVSASARLRFSGELAVTGRSRRSSLSGARLELAAVHHTTGEVIDVPMKVDLVERKFRLHVEANIADLYPVGSTGRDELHLRLRLVWKNSVWETVLNRAPVRGGIEVSYSLADTLRLMRS